LAWDSGVPGILPGISWSAKLGLGRMSPITEISNKKRLSAFHNSSQLDHFFMGCRGPVLWRDSSPSQSVKSDTPVRISLFQQKDKKYDALSTFIESHLRRRNEDLRLLLIVGSGFLEIGQLRHIRPGHVFSLPGPQRTLSECLPYVFLDVPSLLSLEDLPPFKIISVQSDVVAQVAIAAARHFHFY
jgi:hypothetical protein